MNNLENDIQQTQGALRLMEALSGIDEELLERSSMPGTLETIAQSNGSEDMTKLSQNSKHRRIRVIYRNIAACLGLVVAGALSWNALRPIWSPKGAESSSADNAGGSQWESAYNQSADDIELENNLTVEAEDTNAESGTEERTGEILEDFETEMRGGRDTGSRLTDDEKELDKLGSVSDENSGMQDGSAENLMSTASPKMELTEAEARSIDVVGAFIPDDIPAGYTYESAYLDSQGAVTVIWHHGTDRILINVLQVVPEDYKTVDVDRTETYDVRRYEIPYGETVPSEYIETFLNPIFLWEDMSLEIVSSRMRFVEDTGGTNAPQGDFSVLYPEGVLLYFNGRGTAKEIWNMLSSMGK